MHAWRVAVRDGRADAVAFQPLDGVPVGCRAVLGSAEAGLAVGDGWLGRVVDPLGRPLDGLVEVAVGGAVHRLGADALAGLRGERVGRTP